MKKLLQLLNEYEESRWSIVAEDSEEYQAAPTRLENDGHVRHINANKVAYDKDTFDAYVLSKKYGFIRWLVKNGHTTLEYGNGFKNTVSEKTLITVCAVSDDPIKTLMNYLS